MNPLTPLELLDIIEREHGFESPSIRLALTELAEIKRDVARYFALEKRLDYVEKIESMEQTYRDTLKELCELENKLSKVGNEE